MQDALSLTEFELMELLDVGMAEVTSALAHISELVCPPCQTVCNTLYIHSVASTDTTSLSYTCLCQIPTHAITFNYVIYLNLNLNSYRSQHV